MTDPDLLARHNYDRYVPENFEPWMKFEPWMNFAASPPVGQPAPDFPLWRCGDTWSTARISGSII